MISNWRFVEGGSYFEPQIKSAWCCQIYDRALNFNLEQWFLEQGARDEVDYELNFRYNSGNPAYFISIYKEELATAFLLRWKQ